MDVQPGGAGPRIAGRVQVDLERVDEMPGGVLLDQLPQSGRDRVRRQAVQRQVHEQPVDAQLVVSDNLAEAGYGLGDAQADVGQRTRAVRGIQPADHRPDAHPDGLGLG